MMTERGLTKINWFAAFTGFGVDLIVTQVVGFIVVSILLSLQGVSLTSEDVMPSDAEFAYQTVGVFGALVGGLVAGYLARRKGSLHGVLGSIIGLMVFFCSVPLLGSPELSVGDLGFIVLNLVAAGYAGGLGERWRAKREGDGAEDT
jgi:peptidoglycan/LPS O-acetylase OafA/YrhL